MPRFRVTFRAGGSAARRTCWWAGIALLRVGHAVAASNHVTDAIRSGLPNYDALAHETAVTAGVTPAAESRPATTPTATKGADDANQPAAVVLPRLVVRPTVKAPSAQPASRLPRTSVQRAPGRDVPNDPFLTDAARDEALVKKHLTAFDRKVLNRSTLPIFGISKERRAREAEAIEQSARALGAIADLTEVASLEGADPAEQKKLKELYFDAFVGRAK